MRGARRHRPSRRGGADRGKLIAALRAHQATGGGKDRAWLEGAAQEARDEGDLDLAARLEEQAAAFADIDLLPWAGTYWAAFWRLNRGRAYVTAGVAGPAGMMLRLRPLPIGFDAIDAYAARFGIDGEAFEALLEIVTRVDAAWLEEETG